MDGLTAAHLSLPFDTVVRVHNLDNGRSVEVRINDRGPFVKRRLIDVSREAARRIELIGPGTARVELTVIATPQMTRAGGSVSPPPAAPVRTPQVLAAAATVAEPAKPDAPPDPFVEPTCSVAGGHSVQVGSFAERANAEELAARIAGAAPVAIQRADLSGRLLYRVLVGRGLEMGAANSLRSTLESRGVSGFVIQLQDPFCELF